MAQESLEWFFPWVFLLLFRPVTIQAWGAGTGRDGHPPRWPLGPSVSDGGRTLLLNYPRQPFPIIPHRVVPPSEFFLQIWGKGCLADSGVEPLCEGWPSFQSISSPPRVVPTAQAPHRPQRASPRQASPPAILRLQSKGAVFLLVPLWAPPPESSFPAPGYTCLFPEGFPVECPFLPGEIPPWLAGVRLALGPAPKDKTQASFLNPLPSLQHSKTPFHFLIRGHGVHPRPRVLAVCLPSALQPQHTFSKKNTKLQKHTTCRNGAIYIHSWGRDISFIKIASISFPTPSHSLAEQGAHGRHAPTPTSLCTDGVILLVDEKDNRYRKHENKRKKTGLLCLVQGYTWIL